MRKGRTGVTTFDCHWKNMESWVGMKNPVFCRRYSAPTLFPYLQKRSLMFRECSTLQTCYPTNYGPRSSFSYNNLTAPSHGQAFHIISAATQGRAEQLWAWVLLTFTSTKRERDYWRLETSSMSLRSIVFSLDENTRKVVKDQEILSNKDKEYKHR